MNTVTTTILSLILVCGICGVNAEGPNAAAAPATQAVVAADSPALGAWDFETPDQAGWHFVIESVFNVGRDGGAYLAREFKWALDNQPDLILLSSWNDWAFGNMIEPSDEYGEKYLDLLAQMLNIYAGARSKQ